MRRRGAGAVACFGAARLCSTLSSCSGQGIVAALAPTWRRPQLPPGVEPSAAFLPYKSLDAAVVDWWDDLAHDALDVAESAAKQLPQTPSARELREALVATMARFYRTQSADDKGVCGVDEAQSQHEVDVVRQFLENDGAADRLVERLLLKQLSHVDIVELGCGQGRMTAALSPLIRSLRSSGAKVEVTLTLVDQSEPLLLAAATRVANGESIAVDGVKSAAMSVDEFLDRHPLMTTPSREGGTRAVIFVMFGVCQYLTDATLMRLIRHADALVLHEDACDVSLDMNIKDEARIVADAMTVEQALLRGGCTSIFGLPPAAVFKAWPARSGPSLVPVDAFYSSDGSVIRHSSRFERLLTTCDDTKEVIARAVDSNVSPAFQFFPHFWLVARRRQ